MRILLCEDERELSNAIVAILKHHNYTVDAVYDGTDALDYAISGEYDVILLDIMMPKMNGLEVLRQLRKIHVCRNIFLTFPILQAFQSIH